MANAWTKGPWDVVMHGSAAYIRMFIGKHDLPPSATGAAEFSVQPYVRPAEALANARLIAAAPDMAEALAEAERFMAYFSGETDRAFIGSGTPSTCLSVIRAALAKTRGE